MKVFKYLFLIVISLCIVVHSYAQKCPQSLTSPSNGSTNVSLASVTFTWTAPSNDAGLLGYMIYVGTNGSTDNEVAGSFVWDPSYTLTNLKCNTTYTWRVSPFFIFSGIQTCNTTSSFTTAPASGNPNTFGSNVWNVYSYADNNFSNYTGYYTENNLNFASAWSSNSSPSSVPGYVGCTIPADNHSVRFKRRGFPVGTYRINIPTHDDNVALIINGVTVFTHEGCCDSHTNVWTGNLNGSSTIEYRLREFTGDSYGSLSFLAATPAVSISAGAIGSSQTICTSSDPAAFTSSQDASSNCFKYYQWQSSTDNSTWTNIVNATSITYDVPATLTQTTHYRRKATDACGNSAETSPVTITVYSTGVWTGATSSSWTTPSNWCGSIPSATTDVVIKANAINMPVINGAGVCRNLTVEAGATLTIFNTFSLNIHGAFVNNGTFVANQGTVRFVGPGSQTIPALNYYNLESTGPANRLFSTAGTIGIAGTFDKGLSNFLSTGSSVDFNGNGNQVIPALTYNNLKISGSGNKSLSGDILVNGNFDAGLIDISNYSATLNGNVSSSVIFKGNQSSGLVLGSTSNLETPLIFQPGFERLNNFQILKDGDITLGTPLTIYGLLQFPSSGKLFTSNTKLLTLQTSATHAGSSGTSYVEGPMAKVMGHIGEFTFPIGKGTMYRPAGVITDGNLATTFTAEFFDSDPSAIATQIEKPALDHISAVEYWDIHKEGLTNAKVKLYWGIGSYVSLDEADYLSLRVAHYNSALRLWENVGGDLDINSDYNAGNLTTTAYLSDFSPFTFSSTTTKNTLPVVYEWFRVDQVGNDAQITWQTSEEINNDGFEIQKSVGNAENFTSIGYLSSSKKVKSRYSFIDKEFNKQTTYYRLKQIDYNKEYSFSEVKNLKGINKPQIRLYPNPTRGELSLSISDFKGDKISYSISTSEGVVVKNQISIDKDRINESLTNALKSLPLGVYIITLSSGDQYYTDKIVKY